MSWPDGQNGSMRLVARARDAVTPRGGGAPQVCAEDAFEVTLLPNRSIAAIEAQPSRPVLARLVGQRGGGGLRQALQELVPEERRQATPLYLILDDIGGASLVAAWAWSRWKPDWLASHTADSDAELGKALQKMEGICIGFAPGGSAFDPETKRSRGTPVPDLRHPDDPQGWHSFTVQDGVGMRRARRIDVRLDGERVLIDSAFQDSATTPEGGRAAVHEYRLQASADLRTMRLRSVEAEPRILPWAECPGAAANLPRLLGTPLEKLRETVLVELRGTAGCTHLNDALRALAEVPALVNRLCQSLAAAESR